MSWLSRTVSKIGEAHKDVTKAVVNATTMPGSLITGKHVYEKKDFKTDVGKVANSTTGFSEDVVKAGAYAPIGSVNSVTGHKTKLTFNTKAGRIVGKVSTTSVDSLHIVGKSFANTISLGYASKATDLLRDKDHKEAGGNFHEYDSAMTQDTGVKALDKWDNFSKKGAAVVGKIYGVKVMADKVKQVSNSTGVNVGGLLGAIPGDNGNKSVGSDHDAPSNALAGGPGFGAGPVMMIVAVVLLFVFGKYLKPSGR